MTYSDFSKRRVNLNEATIQVAREVMLHIGYFVSGVLVSKGAVLSDLSPFGASFAAAVPFSYLPSGMLGCIIGFLIKNPIDSFRYIAVVVSISALRWVLNEVKKVSKSRFFPSLVSFVPVLLTGLALTFSSSSELTQITKCFMEAIFSAAGAYFFSRTIALFEGKKSLMALKTQELACIAMSSCILLLAFSSLTIGDISVGRIIALVVVLLSSRYGGVSGGSIAGVATGIVFSLSSNELVFICAGFAFSGLMGGLFAPMGKLAVAISMLVCNTTMSFSSSDNELIFAIFVESVLSATIFMLLPKSLSNYITNIFSKNGETPDNEAVRQAVTMRLSFASKALSNVSSCVNSVSEKLSRHYSSDDDFLYNDIKESACSSCGMRFYCHEKLLSQTKSDFSNLYKILRINGFVKEADIEENFSKKCCRTRELVFAINQSYKDYRSAQAAKSRITQIRSVVASQFSGLSDILEDLADEFMEYEKYDVDCSNRVVDALSSLSLCVTDCSCRVSKGKGMVVDVVLIMNQKMNISKSQVMREISRACGRVFDSPQITYELDRVRLVLCERPTFDIEIGSSQHICNNGELCGDCINYFNNGSGSTVLILSDGMGSGSRAAVDSNMAVSIMSKLCRAGLSYDCSLQVVNSSLMIKSEDETMATLDVLDFNLFSGKLELLKAGACVTYIKKNSKLYKKDMSSLPVGILNEVQFAKEAITLSAGDMVLMVSDGVMAGNTEYVEKIFMNHSSDDSMEELSQKIVEEAKKHRNDGHDDDITALALRVIEN